MKIYIFIFVILFSACSALRKSNETKTSDRSNKLAITTRSDNPLLYMQSDTLVRLSRYKGDTSEYIRHNFIENKQKYIGKELNTLLKDLEIPIKSYRPVIPWNSNDSIPSIHLYFHSFKDVSTMYNNRQNPRFIIIVWKHSLPFDSIMKRGGLNKFAWTIDDKIYFGKQIIRDVDASLW